jgi:hypothetical protein
MSEPTILEKTMDPVGAPESIGSGTPVKEKAEPDNIQSKDDEAIFDASHNCIKLFEHIQSAEHENHSGVRINTDNFTLHESPPELEFKASAATHTSPSGSQTRPSNFTALRNSFALWIDSTGALSLKGLSLDARLRGFTEISSITVELLDMISRNLQRRE